MAIRQDHCDMYPPATARAVASRLQAPELHDLNFADFATIFDVDEHACDIAARAHHLGLTDGPTATQEEQARIAGGIHVPTADVSWATLLRPPLEVE